MIRDCLPTYPNLFARGIDVDTIRCKFCQNGIETCRHIFKNCSLVVETRDKLTRWIGLDIPALSPMSLISWCDGLQLSQRKDHRLRALIYIWWWLLWMARNKLVHDGIRETSSNLFNGLMAISFLWVTNRRKGHGLSWLDWVVNPLNVND